MPSAVRGRAPSSTAPRRAVPYLTVTVEGHGSRFPSHPGWCVRRSRPSWSVCWVLFGALVAGTAGVIAAVMAPAVVLAFFALGQMAVQKVLATESSAGAERGAGVYMGQIVVLFILLAALRNATFFDPRCSRAPSSPVPGAGRQ